MNLSHRLKLKLMRVPRAMVLRANYALNNYKEVIWLIGDGRSGTTWVSDLLNYDHRYREMLEPFHPTYVPEMEFLIPHQYARRGESNQQLLEAASAVLSGKLVRSRVDAGNSIRMSAYRGLLVKDIFANLLSYWAVEYFPKVKPVLLMRNPFAVAMSKGNKDGWHWLKDPMELMKQKELHQDFLEPFEDVIKEVSSKDDFLLSQILIWCIINYVPLRQFAPQDIHVCFYEQIFTEPEREVAAIFKFVRGEDFDEKSFVLPDEVINRPSRVAGNQSNLVKGNSPVTSWKNEIAPELIEEGLRIMKHFGLDELYDENSMPNMEVVRKIQGQK